MQFQITGSLSTRYIYVGDNAIEVLGSERTRTIPEKHGLGKLFFKGLSVVSKIPVVGFAEDDVVEFYRKIGFQVYPKQFGKWVVSDRPLPEDFTVKESW